MASSFHAIFVSLSASLNVRTFVDPADMNWLTDSSTVIVVSGLTLFNTEYCCSFIGNLTVTLLVNPYPPPILDGFMPAFKRSWEQVGALLCRARE